MTNKEVYENLLELKQAMDESTNKRIYATVTHVANSGMSRCVKFYYVNKDGNIYNLTPRISRITGYRLTDKGVRIRGCGMDVIFNLLYNINYTAVYCGIIKPDENHTERDLYYDGLVNTIYWML